jgi:glycosyltransferase involved in cell wall biosynthesis
LTGFDAVVNSPQSRAATPAAQVPCRTILMVGTDPCTKGGISTVVRGYTDAGLFERYDVHYVVTHLDGNLFAKAAIALKGWFRVVVLLAILDAPLVHIHLSSRASFWRKFVVCVAARIARRPYVLHLHGSEFMQFYEAECGPLRQRLVRVVFRGAALTLALSEQWRMNVQKICPEANVEVLPNSVSLPGAATLIQRNVESAELVVLFLGRLGTRKGVFELLEAFARVTPRFPMARLVCAGDGAVEEAIERARSLKISQRVSCPGWLSADQVGEALRTAAVFVLPSHAEGLPMALLEAMSWQLPVIATPIGGIPQVVTGGCNGLLVPPGDVDQLANALARLLQDRALRARLGAAARATIEEGYSASVCVERLAAIYARFGIETRSGAKAL